MDKIQKTSKQSWKWWRWVLMILNMIALVLSIVLSLHFLKGGSILGCTGESSCNEVLNSRWSMIAGILPVSSLAVGTYLAILVSSFFIGPSIDISVRRLAWIVLLILAGSIIGSAIWFFILQKWFIGSFCFYCMTTHITGIFLSTLVIWRSSKEFSNSLNNSRGSANTLNENKPLDTMGILIQPLRTSRFVFIGLLLAGTLSAAQFGFASKVIYSSGKSRDTIPFINYHKSPIIGSPDAPYIISLLFDYQCPHCQKIHFMLKDAVRQYNGKLAFVLCPTPLNAQCNPYIPENNDAFKNSCELAKIGLAVWLANPKMFTVFEEWIFTYETGDRWQPRNLESVKMKAVELIGQSEFDNSMTNPWVKDYLKTSTDIFGQSIQEGKRGIPKLIFESHWVIPEANNTEELIQILQKSLGLPLINE